MKACKRVPVLKYTIPFILLYLLHKKAKRLCILVEYIIRTTSIECISQVRKFFRLPSILNDITWNRKKQFSVMLCVPLGYMHYIACCTHWHCFTLVHWCSLNFGKYYPGWSPWTKRCWAVAEVTASVLRFRVFTTHRVLIYDKCIWKWNDRKRTYVNV